MKEALKRFIEDVAIVTIVGVVIVGLAMYGMNRLAALLLLGLVAYLVFKGVREYRSLFRRKSPSAKSHQSLGK
jgi:hypothetical protein